MTRPKDSRHSNRYKGNLIMIEKLVAIGQQVVKPLITTAPDIDQERNRRMAAQEKRQRKQQRRLTK